MAEGQEIPGVPLRTRRQSPAVVAPGTAACEAMARLVSRRSRHPGLLAVRARWPDRAGPALLAALDDGLAVSAVGGPHLRRCPPPHHRRGWRARGRRPTREPHAHRAACGMRRQGEVRRHASAGTPQRLGLLPPCPAAACWCARTTVASSSREGSLGACRSRAKSRSHTPAWAQGVTRWCSLFQWP